MQRRISMDVRTLHFFNPTSSFWARGLRKFCGKMPHRGFLPINSSFTNRISTNVNSFCRGIIRINPTYFIDIEQGVRPCGAKKLEILAIFRVFFNRKPPNIHGLAWNLARRRGPPRGPAVPSAVPNFTLIRESCRPCGGEKPQNHLLSKCNNGNCPTSNNNQCECEPSAVWI